MSLAALALVVTQLVVAGIPHETDEGTAAHLWQLLMAGQVPLIVWFIFRWLPKGPRQAIPVLAVQFVALVAAAAPVVWLGL
jgi:uncharacterized BrkB/YihY/UPF0761 family membrane protein